MNSEGAPCHHRPLPKPSESPDFNLPPSPTVLLFTVISRHLNLVVLSAQQNNRQLNFFNQRKPASWVVHAIVVQLSFPPIPCSLFQVPVCGPLSPINPKADFLWGGGNQLIFSPSWVLGCGRYTRLLPPSPFNRPGQILLPSRPPHPTFPPPRPSLPPLSSHRRRSTTHGTPRTRRTSATRPAPTSSSPAGAPGTRQTPCLPPRSRLLTPRILP